MAACDIGGLAHLAGISAEGTGGLVSVRLAGRYLVLVGIGVGVAGVARGAGDVGGGVCGV